MRFVELKGTDKLPEWLDGKRRMNAGDAAGAAREIIKNVRERGDEALREYTLRYDGVALDSLKVNEREIEEAYDKTDAVLRNALEHAAHAIREFHERQRQNSWFDVKEGKLLGQLVRPIASAGIYVPGGTAAYPSSVLMNALPAKVAGVERIAMCSPPMADGSLPPLVLAAARVAGVSEIYKIGGAQAIAALAYGTESVKSVDKIVGPGNAYVAAAKREVFGAVGIDMIAGPSEICVIADTGAKARLVAADLLSQAEHDKLAAAVLITDCPTLAHEIEAEIERQLKALPREEIARAALDSFGTVILTESLRDAVRLANAFAPEHLELAVVEPMALLPLVENAGAIFLGYNTPEPVGDYIAGPNHVLPTSGTARFSSPLGVDDFTKRSSVLSYTGECLCAEAADICALADAEGLHAHGESIRKRVKG